ncbi:TPA_asm: hypothetical protein G1Q02_05455 [Salmonella enterica subsp. enterica serovar Typhimurium]|nr:hypothetical protein [Salmonella enterica subsp. enterica serovar Typhimurium]
MVKAWGTASVNGSVSDHDLQYLDDVIAGKVTPSDADKDTLTSKVRGRAAVVTDLDAIALPFDVVNLDLTGLVGMDRTYGSVAQLSVTF